MDEEAERNRRRVGKRKYRYDRRTRAIALETKRRKMVSWESVAHVFERPCCDQECTRKIPPSVVLALRTELHAQTFQVKSSKLLEVHRTMHSGSQSAREVVTVEGIDMCPHAWRIVHDVPQRTFQRYKAKAKADIRGAPHGNFRRMKTRTATVQAIQTLRSLLEASADHMPHLTRTLQNGEKVGLKVLPSGTQWKDLQAAVNEVRISY